MYFIFSFKIICISLSCVCYFNRILFEIFLSVMQVTHCKSDDRCLHVSVYYLMNMGKCHQKRNRRCIHRSKMIY